MRRCASPAQRYGDDVKEALQADITCGVFSYTYSKRHNKFLFPALAETINGSSCKAENEISNVVNYNRSGNSEREIREHI